MALGDVVRGMTRRIWYGAESDEYKAFVDNTVLNTPEMKEKTKKAINRGLETMAEAEAAGIGPGNAAYDNLNESTAALQGDMKEATDSKIDDYGKVAAGVGCGIVGACIGDELFGKWGAVAGAVIFGGLGAGFGGEYGSDIIAAAKYVTQDEFSGDDFGKKIERFISAAGSNLSTEGQTYTEGVVADNLAASKTDETPKATEEQAAEEPKTATSSPSAKKFDNLEEIYQGNGDAQQESAYNADPDPDPM